MLKKIISIAVVAAMICTVFAGCTADDVALFKALQKVPESSITHQTASFDITVEEPMSSTYTYSYSGDDESYTEEDKLPMENYLLQLIGGLLSVTDIETTVTKSGGVMETKLSYTLPDASFSFKSWIKADEKGQAQQAVFALPSYVRPFLPVAIAKKQYVSVDMAKYTEYVTGITAPAMADMGVIGGADGPTAIVTTTTVTPKPDAMATMLTLALQDDKMIDQLASMLNISFVTGVERSGGNTIYTVKLDGPALKSLIKGIVSTISGDDAAAMIALMAGTTAAEYKEGLEGADKYADVIGDFLINSGMFDNGITVKYTVNSDGYVVHTEQNLDIYVDMPKIAAAVVDMGAVLVGEVTPEDIAEAKEQLNVTGKFRIAASIVSDVTSINAALDVKLPELTEENCIDVIGDIEEYSEYDAAYDEWWNSWYDDRAERAYAEMHVPGETLVLRNNETGVEVTTIPKTRSEIDPEYDEDFYYYNSIYVPITDLAQVFDGVHSITRNDELQGIEVRYNMFYDDEEEYVNLILNPDGRELYFDAEDDTPYEEYYYVYPYLSDFQFADDGKFYVSLSYFNGNMDYRSRFEGDKYCYTSRDNTRFQSDMDMSGNFIYEFENMFEY